jgi:hypothetical protein
MGRRAVLIIAVVAVAGVGATNALGAAPSGVTIHYKKSKGLYGFVFSPNPKRCAARRDVKVFKQHGKTHSRRDAKHVGFVHTHQTRGGKYKWHLAVADVIDSLRTGKYFAFVRQEHGCQSDYSKTIHISVQRPQTKITGMTIHHQSHRVRFDYKATDGFKPYHFRCRLDDGHYQHCPGRETTYADVSPGHHVFRVRAIDDNDLWDRSPAKRGFRM